MKSVHVVSRPPRALLFAALAVVPLLAAVAAAQGFGSVSTAQPAVVAAPEPAPAPTNPDVPLGPPAAQLAAVGFASVSSAGTAGAAPAIDAPPLAVGGGSAVPAGSYEPADAVLVDKSDRRLYLLKHGRVIAEYPIKLGLNPYGHKVREGDFRTPEGKYTLNRRNPNSEFFLGIQISYPNREDAAWAKENGHSPGGLIMIHGQPNVPKKPPEHYATRDWTDGCIALTNEDMVDVWLRTRVGLPIEIRP
jgi:lipoprotein-anchoring transpeptidase ErfK/SrfK